MAMLDGQGRLTDVGSWYLGGPATNVVPSASGATRIFKFGGSWVALITIWFAVYSLS